MDLMQISVVIPTCNRRARLLSLLQNLDHSLYPIYEVIIVDSGDERLSQQDYTVFKNLKIQYLKSERSVCIQRNTGIKKASAEWILLCDDDIELPEDYLQKLIEHLTVHPDTAAVSGLWLQLEKENWKATFPETSALWLYWKYIFGLGLWGEINCSGNNIMLRKIKQYYKRKGNHISKAGWPVLTDFSGSYFVTPVYSLGASLIKKECLLISPFDEVLDRHGIGDNYGVATGFPSPLHIVTNTFVFHHQEGKNRLMTPLQYFRRALALDYFRKSRKVPAIKKTALLWSLTGNLLLFLLKGDAMTVPAFKTLYRIALKKNPYRVAALNHRKITEPEL